MTDFFELGVQKYWAPTSTVSKEVRRMKLEQAIESNNYIWSEKFDGNFLRAVVTPERNALLTRGISTVNKTYGEVDPTFTATAEGTVQDVDLVCSATREKGENVGTIVE